MSKFIATILASLLLTAAGNTFAGDRSDGPGKRGKHGSRGSEGAMIMEHFKRELRQLDLSDDQQADVKAIMQDLHAQSRLIGEEQSTNQEQLAELIKAESWDENAAAQLAAKEGDLTAQRTLLTSKALADIYAQLNPDQRAELAANAEERKARHEARREAHQQRKPADD